MSTLTPARITRERSVSLQERRFILRNELVKLAVDSLRSGKVRFFLTALGMVIGTASVILVVSIGLTGKQFILEEIQKIGTNEIELEYAGTTSAAHGASQTGALTPEDEQAIDAQLPNIQYSSPVLAGRISISLEGGSSRETQLLGVSPQYRFIRNLVVSEGRFFDELDEAGHLKCAVVTESLARQRFGSAHDAIGQELIIKRVPFTIIGVFRESVSDFGQSEIALDTVLVPYAEARFFTGTDQVSQIYFSMRSMNDVPEATRAIKTILTVRHGLDFLYATQDLGDVLEMAARISDIVTVVLILVAAVTLVVGGVGIMNIMLANVQARTHEIGLRKALGATFREIRFQFLSESVIISLAGGIVGCIAGLALPVSVRLFTDYDLPINLWSVGIALAAAALTGVLFGTLPATRAAHLDPVDSLRYE